MKPFCDCESECLFGNRGRAFRLCKGTDQTIPRQERQRYRDLMTGAIEPKTASVDEPAPELSFEDEEQLSPEQIDQLYGCKACGRRRG